MRNIYRLGSLLLFFTLFTGVAASQTVINYTDNWKFNIPISDPGTAWRGLGFDDTVPLNGAAWGSGPGLLGYDGDFPGCCPSVPPINTAVGSSGNGLVTYLFRKTFTFSGDPAGATFVIDHIVDDGVTYYLNGNLIGSVRHSPGAWNAVADTPFVGNAAEELSSVNGLAMGLVNGTNVLCAEVHNNGAGGSDMVFGAKLKITVAPATPPIRIMPLGDSITFGSSIEGAPVPGGYRGPLYTSLTSAGYNVDFLGTDTRNGGGGSPDSEHEGHPGWRINMLDERLATWLNTAESADMVLLHIGTNDFGFNQDNLDITKAINRLDALIGHIATQRPFAQIIVTNLLQRSDSWDAQIQTHFNPFVSGVVSAHAAQGRRVTYLDMRSQLTLGDLAEGLHPNQTGYNKMAAAWLGAIQALTAPNGDSLPPAIASVVAQDNTHVVVTFSKPVENAAATPSNFGISGLTISAASISADKKKIVLTTSAMTNLQTYMLAVSNVKDRTTPQHTIVAGSTKQFTGPSISGVAKNAPEAVDYKLVYSLNIPNTADFNSSAPVYAVDNRSGLGAYTRVAYYLELQKAGGALQYCWVSMDSFSNDANKIGVPHSGTGAVFQQHASNVKYVSNVTGVGNSSIRGLDCNLEFWPTDYGPADGSYFLFPASSTALDSGDQNFGNGNFGSMQVHIPGAAKTLIAYNRWGGAGGNVSDIGIGNNPVPPHKDWSFSSNASGYTVKTLQVYVRPSQEFPLSFKVNRQGSTVDVSYIGTPNGTYRVQRATNLSIGMTWDNLADLSSGTAGDISYTDTNAPTGKVFYRMMRLSPP